MQLLIKFFPEIAVKSRVVRGHMTRQLGKNIRRILGPIDEGIVVECGWDALHVTSQLTDPLLVQEIKEQLCCIPGIAIIQEVEKMDLPSLDQIAELCVEQYSAGLSGKTFAVRCRRVGKHSFSSVDVERTVGAKLLKASEAAGVELKNPQATVQLEIRQQELFLVKTALTGLGGYPLGTQESVVSLISGGFDSSVSSYLCIRRGLQTHYCFFNLGGTAHELAVKEIAYFLWDKYHRSQRVQFITVPFEGVVEEILEQVDNAFMGVILKRLMLKAASQVARKLHIKAIATGESIAQVSSQTLLNLAAIDTASEALVLRPLITTDKQDIIDLARKIGTEQFSMGIPEYCAVISKNPTTSAKPDRVEREEARLNSDILAKALEGAKYQLVTDIVGDFENYSAELNLKQGITDNSTIIDIRHPSEKDAKPFKLPKGTPNVPVIEMPFYKLNTQFSKLDAKTTYLLHCDRGVMSKLHAAHLRDAGFENVAVYDASITS